MDTPIACSLSATGYQERKEQIAAVAGTALLSRESSENGARLTFADADGVEDTLREIIAAEAECCSFLEFDLTRDGQTLELVVTGPAQAQPIIEELFA